MRRRVVWLLVLAGLLSIAWYIDVPEIVADWARELAIHQDVAKSFNDPVSGRIDALILLVSFSLLLPVLLIFVLLGFVFVLIVFLLFAEPAFRALRVPLWTCVPIVLGGAGLAAHLTRETWFPQLVYVLRLTAKAGVVFFSSAPPVPR
jgi:hypothetical protein